MSRKHFKYYFITRKSITWFLIVDEAGLEPTRSALQTDALPLELFVLSILFMKPTTLLLLIFLVSLTASFNNSIQYCATVITIEIIHFAETE